PGRRSPTLRIRWASAIHPISATRSGGRSECGLRTCAGPNRQSKSRRATQGGAPERRFEANTMANARADRRGQSRETVLIDLALQGGGSHGAFTWGVLDRLL